MTKATVAFHTLGCKLNFSETSAIARSFEESGFLKTEFDSGADVCVINTCSVTENADAEFKEVLNRALRKNPDAFIAVTGCYAQLKPGRIAGIPGVDIVLGANEKFNVVNYICDAVKKQKAEIFSCDIGTVTEFKSSFSLHDRTRSFLKVQDGCDFNCSFCTIPLARGKSRSNTIEKVIRDVETIAKSGCKEIVLTGINLGDFGYYDSAVGAEISFPDLIRKIDKVNGIERFRISSIEPNLLSDEIIEFVASSEKFVPHFHIPLQSGSDKILKLMRRRYQKELYEDRVEKIKSLMPHCCIGADVIVGFPGETEEDFAATFDFISKLDISYLHVFTYSERDNTFAISLPGIVSYTERKRRNKMLRTLSEKKRMKFYQEHSGKVFKVLFESDNKNGMMHGFTENYIKVKAAFEPQLINRIMQVKLTGVDQEGCGEVRLTGELHVG